MKRRMKDDTSERGAAMVEMAIVLPVLLILVFAIIEMGIALNRVQAFQAAAREGARIGSLETTTSGEIDAAVTGALVGISGDAPTIEVLTGTCAGRPGGKITVAEGVIEGCTEIAMLVGQQHVEVPLFDTTEIHAEEAVVEALR